MKVARLSHESVSNTFQECTSIHRPFYTHILFSLLIRENSVPKIRSLPKNAPHSSVVSFYTIWYRCMNINWINNSIYCLYINNFALHLCNLHNCQYFIHLFYWPRSAPICAGNTSAFVVNCRPIVWPDIRPILISCSILIVFPFFPQCVIYPFKKKKCICLNY